MPWCSRAEAEWQGPCPLGPNLERLCQRVLLSSHKGRLSIRVAVPEPSTSLKYHLSPLSLRTCVICKATGWHLRKAGSGYYKAIPYFKNRLWSCGLSDLKGVSRNHLIQSLYSMGSYHLSLEGDVTGKSHTTTSQES